MTKTKTVNLEKSLDSLEKLVDELESGDLPLEKAMQKFEEGIKLTRSCQTALRDAEQKVEILLQDTDGQVEEFLEDNS
jgi:exodeoxyribonuclease VII small subunit